MPVLINVMNEVANKNDELSDDEHDDDCDTQSVKEDADPDPDHWKSLPSEELTLWFVSHVR